MALKKITGKDIKEAVDWLWEHKEGGGCIHHVLGTTDDGTKLCFVVGWAAGRDYGDDDKKYGYFDEGYCISAKIGYQHSNNAMQSDYEWDFNMPYDTETGDVWDTSSYVPRDADWEREAADYNKEAQKIWDTYGKPGKDGTTALDLMESKKSESAKGSMRRKQESIQKKKESVLNSVYPVITSDDTLRYALLATTRIRKNDMVRIVPCIEYQGKLCQVYTGRVDDPVWYRAGRISDNKDLHNDKAFVAVVDTPQEALQEFRKLGNPGVTRIAMQSENCVYWDDVSDEGTIKVKNTAPFCNDYYDIEVPDNGTTINDGIDGSMGGNNWRATVYWKPKDAVTAAFKWLDNLMAQARKKGDSLVAQQSDHRSKGSAIKSRIATFQDDAD